LDTVEQQAGASARIGSERARAARTRRRAWQRGQRCGTSWLKRELR